MTLPKADSIPLAAVALATVVGLYFTIAGTFVGVSAEPDEAFASVAEAELFELMRAEFGGFLQPQMSGDWKLDALLAGRAVYEVQCVHCHGTDGRAKTPTAKLLTPPPRDFGLGIVKFTSTPVGLPATRADLLRTLIEGVPSTSMSSFKGLEVESLDAVANYAMYLLIRGAVWSNALEELQDSSASDAFEAAMLKQRQQFSLAIASWGRPDIPAAADSARGRELYFSAELGCVVCHQEDGSGGLVNAEDIWGVPMIARDLQQGVLRGGTSPADVYLRIRNGVKGTKMPPMAEHLEAEQIWDLVAFVHSMQEHE
jgi:mono/diheme cytochrome c family protein